MNLTLQMKVVLATVFSFYLKAHNYHWNVTGPNFPSYHKFLNDVYEEVWESVDDYAEHIRALNDFAPGSLSHYQSLSVIGDATTVITDLDMMAQLSNDNQLVLEQLYKAHDLAEAERKFGVVNFLEGQIDYHEKLGWMLKSFSPLV